jgi:tetratricopeptide (TPR) repeat protein
MKTARPRARDHPAPRRSDPPQPAAPRSRRSFLKTGLVAATGIALIGPAALPGCATRPEQVTRFYRPRYRTVAHEVLEIEREHKQASQHQDDNLLLDLLIDDARFRLSSLDVDDVEPRDRARATLEALGDLLESCGFTYRRDGTLSHALRLGGANCDSASALYLAFGEVHGLPIKMVRAPGHTFVRWEIAPDRHVNWETTVAEERSDAHYIAKHRIPDSAIGRSALRSLDVRRDRRRILANACVTSGVRWLEKCKPEPAIERFQEAVRRDPLYVSPCYNLGLTYFNLGDPETAVIWCDHAVRLNQNHVKSHSILVAAHQQLGNHAAARRHREAVRRIDSGYYSRKRSLNRRRQAGKFCA